MKSFFLFLLGLFLFVNFAASAQESPDTQNEKLIIGITETPPFVVSTGDSYTGLSISSWELVNRELDMDYEFRAYPTLQDLLTAVENSEVDFSINPITVTDLRMQRMDFSQPYFISYTSIAKEKRSQVWQTIKNIWSWNFISALLLLLGVIFIFGLLVWIFERKTNEEEFGNGTKGLWEGFWWSAVTMTTVGYGDKSPRSLGGRIVGLIWMFMAIVIISSLTAGIASALTVQGITSEINSVADLERFEVASVTGSSSQEFLDQYNINYFQVNNAEEGIDYVREHEGAVFVYDQPILKYEVERREWEDEIEIMQRTLKKDYYSYSFPKGSELEPIINPVLVSSLKTMEWNRLVRNYN